jgi:phage terminase large subunit
MILDLNPQKAYHPLYQLDWREMSYAGGRASAKSFEFSDYVLVKMLEGRRVLCLREIQNSISESVHALLCDRISHFKLDEYFEINKTDISCVTGGESLFKGVLRNIDSIKSMHNIELVWIEEAQTISKESIEILIPTIFRNNNPQIMYSWNPRYEHDAVYQRFVANEKPPKSYHFHVTWRDNKYFSDDMKEEMEFNYRTDPEMADHIWEGALYPSSSDASVIPLAWLKKCVGAHKNIKEITGYEYIGLDFAEEGKDKSAIAYRKGSLIKDVFDFDNKYVSEAVDRAHNYTKDKNIARIYFDANGIGASAKSDFNRICNRDYLAHAFLSTHKAGGDDKKFTDKITNGEFFRNMKAQAWWNIRLRAENTLRLLDGESINPEKCLFIDENITNVDKILLELSQATYKHENSKLTIDKQPEKGNSSPNMADAIVMSFAFDLKKGLTAR